MPLRALAKFLANEHHLVEKLASSYPLRRLAQLTHFTYLKVTQAGQKSLDNFTQAKEAQSKYDGQRDASLFVTRVMRRFFANLQKEIERKNMK